MGSILLYGVTDMSEFKVALTCGVFDCLHDGHIKLIDTIKQQVDYLVVIVHDDISSFQIKNRFPVQRLGDRLVNLWLSSRADLVVPTFDRLPLNEIDSLVHMSESKIVYFRGDDCQDWPWKKDLEERKIDIVYLPYTKGISTTELRNSYCIKE